MKNVLIFIMFSGIIVCLIIASLLFRLDIGGDDAYRYEGVDSYIVYNETRSMSNITLIMDNYGFSYTEWYQRASPEGSGEIIDYIYFSFNYSTSKNISGQIYNFNSDNLTIKLHYYPDDHPDQYRAYQTYEKAKNSSHLRYLDEKKAFEEDVEYIILIFNNEFDSNHESVEYEQLIMYYKIYI
jgi:hypothetical protein